MTFAERVYTALRQVPKGKVTTYKALAQALNTKGYQAIGQALRRNPYAPEVPCHRVVASDGSLCGFNGHRTGENIDRKTAMLINEGVPVSAGKVVDLAHYHFTFRE